MNIKIGHVRTPGIVGVVNANADALIKAIKIGGNFMAYQKSLNRLVMVELVCLLGMSIADYRLIADLRNKTNALSDEIFLLKVKNHGKDDTCAEETEM